jgi:hypothetical protein
LGRGIAKEIYRDRPDSSEEEERGRHTLIRGRRGEDRFASPELRRAEIQKNLER